MKWLTRQSALQKVVLDRGQDQLLQRSNPCHNLKMNSQLLLLTEVRGKVEDVPDDLQSLS